MSFVCKKCMRVAGGEHSGALQHLFPFNSTHVQCIWSFVRFLIGNFVSSVKVTHSINGNLFRTAFAKASWLLRSMDVPMIDFHRLMSRILGSFLMEKSQPTGIRYFLLPTLPSIKFQLFILWRTNATQRNHRKCFIEKISIFYFNSDKIVPDEKRNENDFEAKIKFPMTPAANTFISRLSFHFFPLSETTTAMPTTVATADWILIKFSI